VSHPNLSILLVQSRFMSIIIIIIIIIILYNQAWMDQKWMHLDDGLVIKVWD